VSNFIPHFIEAENFSHKINPEDQVSMAQGLVVLGLNAGSGLIRIFGHVHTAPGTPDEPVGILVVQQKNEHGRGVHKIEYANAEVPLWIAQEAVVMFRYANPEEVWL
jgi:hypothetical protein